MSKNKQSGDRGELDIVEKVLCPNCGKKLMILPPNYPLYDIQCTACVFRAQIKTVSGKPKNKIFGAGWVIMEKVLKAGYLIPPLFVYFKWDGGYEIRFYPFIPKKTLKPYTLSKNAKRANYKMFLYSDLEKLKYYLVEGVHNKKSNVGNIKTISTFVGKSKYLE